MSLKAKDKYKVTIIRTEINWLRLIPNLFFYLVGYSEWDSRNNWVEIINLNDNKIVKYFEYSVLYLNARAKKKLISEDLNNLSIKEFEEKYELNLNETNEEEPEFKIEELD